jgi:hypothetical protein
MQAGINNSIHNQTVAADRSQIPALPSNNFLSQNKVSFGADLIKNINHSTQNTNDPLNTNYTMNSQNRNYQAAAVPIQSYNSNNNVQLSPFVNNNNINTNLGTNNSNVIPSYLTKGNYNQAIL